MPLRIAAGDRLWQSRAGGLVPLQSVLTPHWHGLPPRRDVPERPSGSKSSARFTSGAATAVIVFAFISARNAAAIFIGKATAIWLYVESLWAALPIPISLCRPIPNGRTRSTTGSESRSLPSTIPRDGPLERDDASPRQNCTRGRCCRRRSSRPPCAALCGYRSPCWLPSGSRFSASSKPASWRGSSTYHGILITVTREPPYRSSAERSLRARCV